MLRNSRFYFKFFNKSRIPKLNLEFLELKSRIPKLNLEFLELKSRIPNTLAKVAYLAYERYLLSHHLGLLARRDRSRA